MVTLVLLFLSQARMFSMSLTNNTSASFFSGYTTDKIVGVYSGSFNTDTAPLIGGYIAYTNFSHTFSRPVFTKLQTSSDQVNWKDGNSSNTYSISYSTSSQIYVLHAPSNGLIYYRVLAFWIDDYDTTNPSVPPTVGSESDTYFDSRLNYQKVAMEGEFTIPAGTLSVTNTVTHNLGYKPTVRVFNEAYAGEVWPANYGGGFSNYWAYNTLIVETEVQIKDNTVDILSSAGISSPSSRVWYRIYYDD